MLHITFFKSSANLRTPRIPIAQGILILAQQFKERKTVLGSQFPMFLARFLSLIIWNKLSRAILFLCMHGANEQEEGT
jgi:hypothetical protein